MPEPFTIESRRDSYKDLRVTYAEGERHIVVDLETSGIPAIAWVGDTAQLRQWTKPPALPLTREKQMRVQARLEQWARARGEPVQFGAIDWRAFEAGHRARGWSKHTAVDSKGRVMVTFAAPWYPRLWFRVRRILTAR